MADTLTGIEVTTSPNFPDHDDAANYDFPSLQQCFSFVSALGPSASKPAVINLLPGRYTLTGTATIPSYVTLVGSGKGATQIYRASGSNTTILDASGTTNVRLKDLELFDDGNPGTTTAALLANDAQGMILNGVRFNSPSGGTCFIKSDTSYHGANSAYDLEIRDSQFISTGFDNVIMFGCNTRAFSSYFYNAPTITGSDNVRLRDGNFFFYGCDIVQTSAQTYTANPGASIQLGGGGNGWSLHLIGSHVLFDLSSGNVNGSTVVWGPIVTSGSNEDFNLYIDGSRVEYKTGAITSAAAIGAIILSNAGANATNGSVRLVGSDFRDLGGSGGTVRKDVIVRTLSAGGDKIIKTLTQTGSRFTWGYQISGSPTITHANYGVTEQTMNHQSGVATFATAATVAVTLPVAFTDVAIVDYVVNLEPSINETFWVTAKTNTGFTMNSSNATSTATVRYSVRR